MSQDAYVLITPAFNEVQRLPQTIESVLNQTVRPLRWILISDGSNDGTDGIMKNWEARVDLISYIRREKDPDVSGFKSKVAAIQEAYTNLHALSFEYIGILDADITLTQTYYEQVIAKFKWNPLLGISGGFIFEQHNGRFESRPANTTRSVAGGIQLFRRYCYESIGGHQPMPHGGEDWLCEIMARKKSWQVISFTDIVAFHHNPSDKKRGVLKDAIRQGKMDYSVGSHPLFEIIKCVRILHESPFGLRSLLRLLGFTWSAIKGARKDVSVEVVDYLRREQMHRLRMYLHDPRQ